METLEGGLPRFMIRTILKLQYDYLYKKDGGMKSPLCVRCKKTVSISERIISEDGYYCGKECMEKAGAATGIKMVVVDTDKEMQKQKEAEDKANKIPFVTLQDAKELKSENKRLKKENELLNSYLIDIRSFLYYIRKEDKNGSN
jgi:hypothetical protein